MSTPTKMSSKTPSEGAKKRAVCKHDRARGLYEMCVGMDGAMNMAGSRQGIVPLHLINLKTGKSRVLVAAKSGEHVKRGLVLNFCPWCGTKIYKTNPPTNQGA